MVQRHRFAGLTFLLLGLATAARAEVTNCSEITSVPYLVTASGIYCLKGSLAFAATSGNAIDIQTDDVVLDLNGHVLDGSGAGAVTSARGVSAQGRNNVTVRNGTIRGFRTGAFLGNYDESSHSHIAEELRLDRNTEYGLIVAGQGGIVRRNLVIGTGGSTATPNARAIYAWGSGVHVVDNEVVETVEGAGGRAWGISAVSAQGAVIERNMVSNGAFGPTGSYGILMFNSSAKVVGNRVANMRNGIYFMTGATGIYMDNTVGGATTPFFGGTAAGATNFSF